MAEIRKFWSSLMEDEDGATMVEYGLMVALIAVVCIAAVTLVGNATQAIFNEVAGALENALPAGGG